MWTDVQVGNWSEDRSRCSSRGMAKGVTTLRSALDRVGLRSLGPRVSLTFPSERLSDRAK